jgi:bifunctional non-homologous end joining protein LigD
VATPLKWDELTPKLDPKAFTIRTVPARIARQRTDPWAGMIEVRQRLPDLPRG